MTTNRVRSPPSFADPFWTALEDDTLLIQRCQQCERYAYPPRISCPDCHAEMEWVEAAGHGVVYSYNVVHTTNSLSVNDEAALPLIGAVVELAEGPKMVTNLVHCEIADVAIGSDVSVVYGRELGDTVLPFFELTA